LVAYEHDDNFSCNNLRRCCDAICAVCDGWLASLRPTFLDDEQYWAMAMSHPALFSPPPAPTLRRSGAGGAAHPARTGRAARRGRSDAAGNAINDALVALFSIALWIVLAGVLVDRDHQRPNAGLRRARRAGADAARRLRVVRRGGPARPPARFALIVPALVPMANSKVAGCAMGRVAGLTPVSNVIGSNCGVPPRGRVTTAGRHEHTTRARSRGNRRSRSRGNRRSRCAGNRRTRTRGTRRNCSRSRRRHTHRTRR